MPNSSETYASVIVGIIAAAKQQLVRISYDPASLRSVAVTS
jgi:hypothetical protein